MKKKINIKLYKENRLEKEYNNILAVVNKESYKFIIDDINTIISDSHFQRENDEYKFKIDFVNNEAYFLLKENNSKFDVEIEHFNIDKKEQELILEYKISSDEEIFKIHIEERDNNE